MKRGKILFGAICAVFAAMAFIGCQPTTGGGGSSSLAPFAGTTWTVDDGALSIEFRNNGVAVSEQLFVAPDTNYKYAVSEDGDSRIAIVTAYSTDPDLVGTPLGQNEVLKFVIETADATEGHSYQKVMTSWSSTPDDFTWTKEGAESPEPTGGPVVVE